MPPVNLKNEGPNRDGSMRLASSVRAAVAARNALRRARGLVCGGCLSGVGVVVQLLCLLDGRLLQGRQRSRRMSDSYAPNSGIGSQCRETSTPHRLSWVTSPSASTVRSQTPSGV